MATIEELKQQLNTNAYTPKTEEQIRAEAEAQNRGIYEQNRLSAQQYYDTTIQALQSQLASLGTSYDRQIEEAAKATQATISSRDRANLNRGMQRSSYNAATLANIALQGDKALAQIQEDRTAAESALAGQKTLAERQLAEQLAQLDSTYATDVQAAIDALKEQEYNRQLENTQYLNNLYMQLYQLEEERKANDVALAIKQEQLKSLKGSSSGSSGSGGSGGGSGSGSDNANAAGAGADTTVPPIDNILGTLNGGNTDPAAQEQMRKLADQLKKNLDRTAAATKK